MYHNLPLRTGLVFSFAEGNGVTWIRDYSRLLKLAFSRKDFVKMIGRGGGVRITPYSFIDHHFILGNIILRNRSIVYNYINISIIRECAASEVLSELAFCPQERSKSVGKRTVPIHHRIWFGKEQDVKGWLLEVLKLPKI